jgi:hypothetical protein
MEFGAAQSLCNNIGGHLVVWDSLGEQNEVGGPARLHNFNAGGSCPPHMPPQPRMPHLI